MEQRQVIERAREKLPLPSDSIYDEIVIPVESPITVWSFFKNDYFIVRFRKQFVNELAIGWEYIKVEKCG